MVEWWILSDTDESLCSVVSGSYMIQFNYSNFKSVRTQVFCFNSMTISYPLKPTFIKAYAELQVMVLNIIVKSIL